jgi:hypothetical protein
MTLALHSRRMRTVALLLAFFSLLVGATAADAANRKVPRGWLGTTADGPFNPKSREWNRMKSASVESVRTAFHWARLQPYPSAAAVPPGQESRFRDVGGVPTDFTSTDRIVKAAARRRMELLPVVEWTPSWAAALPGDAKSPPARPQDVSRIFTALVARYGPSGSLWDEQPDLPRRPVRAWQVFNEPNLKGYWSIQPFEQSYVVTLRAAEQAVHAADPAATVVLAGLTNMSWTALDAIYAAGARGSFDAVAIHPYTERPANVVRILRYAREVTSRYGDAQVPIWVTEFGSPAAAGKFPRVPPWADFTDTGQARSLGRVLRRFVAARKQLRIGRVFWYTWLSIEGRGRVFDYSGLRRIRRGTTVDTPALAAFRRWERKLRGCPPRRACR